MFRKIMIKQLGVIATAAVFSLSTLHSAYAAPGTLATAPLFLSTIVEPNVYFTLDDSGSMDWGPMVKNNTAGITSSNGLPVIDNDDRGYYTPSFGRLYTSRGYLPPSETDIDKVVINRNPNLTQAEIDAAVEDKIAEWDRSWVVRNSVGNRNYFDPSFDYKPWAGTNADGTAMYPEADEEKALKDPDDNGTWVDLTAYQSYTSRTFKVKGEKFSFTNDEYYIPTYFVWNDDGDGVLEQDDPKTRVEIVAGTDEMQNFANWFVYYRSRINATKAIIGSTINNTDATRVGMSLFNSSDKFDVDSMGDPDVKRDMLEELYKIEIGQNGTPARLALEAVGDLFDNTGGNPILSDAEGGACQQNFNILMSDGFWNGADPGVGNADSDNSDNEDNGWDGDVFESIDDGFYEDGYSNTLADVAMRNYERDLSAFADIVPTSPGLDEASHQHLVTYSIAFGLTGSLDPLTDEPTDGSPAFNWPEPVANTETTVDDMWHAAYNGRGQFLTAQNPAELEQSLVIAVADIAERTATAAAVAINSTSLNTKTVVYLAEFNTNRWQGDLKAFKFATNPDGTLKDDNSLESSPEWSAADLLNARSITVSDSASDRLILTYDGSDGIPFLWDELTATQKDDLKTNSAGGVDPDATGKKRVRYIHGDRSEEGAGFRERASRLGDLVNSGPVFVGAPALNWPDNAPFPTADGSRYSDFKNGSAKDRDGVVYAAANDGLLHGFSETSGKEVIAYVPDSLFSTAVGEGLHYLTDPDYTHRYFNDLTPSLSDVYADLGNGTQWQTILINGLRGGGRGIYALNVDDPTQFSVAQADNLVLWEFTSDDDADLGYTYSQVQIGLANNGRWVAVFGNGYNDSGSGEATLFILDIAGGLDGSWAGDYVKISTGAGDPSDRNGLATPRLADLDGDGTIDRVYAGDLQGKMWAFDMSGSTTGSWEVSGGAPIFTATDNMPITTQPSIARHPTVSDDGSNDPNLMVYFGTGQYLTKADKTSPTLPTLNHFYAVWDKGDKNLGSGNLVEQSFDSNYNVRVLTKNPVDYLGGADYGWFFALDIEGERTIFKSVLRGGIVFFTTFIPNSDPCSAGGYSYFFGVDMVNGGSPDEPQVDFNKDGEVNEDDYVSNSTGDQKVQVAGGGDGMSPNPVFAGPKLALRGAEPPDGVAELRNIPTGRFSWQELIQ